MSGIFTEHRRSAAIVPRQRCAREADEGGVGEASRIQRVPPGEETVLAPVRFVRQYQDIRPLADRAAALLEFLGGREYHPTGGQLQPCR